jgi:hypothetical protein
MELIDDQGVEPVALPSGERRGKGFLREPHGGGFVHAIRLPP